ncbi:hypothetical protein BY996DRAFT_7143053, partial [Phakopsora pachyrhizi]
LPCIQSIVHEQIEFVGDVCDYLKERADLKHQYGSSLQVRHPFNRWRRPVPLQKAIVKKAMDKQSRL